MFRISRIVPVLLIWAVSSGCDGGAAVPAAARSIVVSPASALIVGVGETTGFQAMALDGSGSPLSADAVVWSSADPAVVTISPQGVATGVSAGTTRIVATTTGANGVAELEVFVPAVPAAYQPSTNYFGRARYVEYVPGQLPVVLSAPHGGALTPAEIPERTIGTTVTDRNTVEMIRAVRDALVQRTGKAPHIVISHLSRTRLDPNREIVEAAQGSPFAELAWDEFQGFIETARQTVELEYGSGMYFDLHGHGHAIAQFELGYLLSASDLDRPDGQLDATAVVAASSIRLIGVESSLPFSRVLRGSSSFGAYLLAEGIPAVPSPARASPGAADYFSGGYNTRRHGSMDDGESISGIQIEMHFAGARDSAASRAATADALAAAIEAYMLEHFGFFASPVEPTPMGRSP